MKKILGIVILALTLNSSPALAGTIVDIQPGKAQLGYTYRSTDATTTIQNFGTIDWNKPKFSEFQAIYGFGDKGGISVEYGKASKNYTSPLGRANLDLKITDIGFSSRFNKNLALLAGYHRGQMDVSATLNDGSHLGVRASHGSVYVGLGISHNISSQLNCYGLYKKSRTMSDLVVGASYDLTKDLALNVNYRRFEYDDEAGVSDTVKGTGFGLVYKF